MDIDQKIIEGEKSKVWQKLEIFADVYLSPIAKFGGYLLFGVPPVLLALGGGLWWLDKNASWGQGIWPVIVLWVFVFNKLPQKGIKCLQDQTNVYFLLPLSIISTLGFVIGYLYRQLL